MEFNKKMSFFRSFILIGIIFMILPFISAIDIVVEQESIDPSNFVYVKELNNDIVFNLKITNNGPSGNFEFYNLLGFFMSPSEKVYISNGETRDVELRITSLGQLPDKGFYTFTYYIRASDKSEVEKRLSFKIVNLKDAIAISSEDIDPESSSIKIFVINKENVDFGRINAEFSSSFFDVEKEFNLGAKETITVIETLNKEKFKDLTAGFYTLLADIEVDGKITRIEGIIRFVEKNIITTTRNEFGFLISSQIIEKVNEGNVVEKSETVVKKNVLSRLFTNFNPEPDLVEREGLIVYYTWINDVKPGEIYKISVKTNWLFPFLIILFIVIIVVLAKKHTQTNLVMRKKISFVKAKGGEFALKVSILVNAKKYLERVNIIDRLPPLVKLYEKFGAEKPSKIDEKNRRLEWNFERLESGETRVLSYIVYSKIGVLGRFALPPTTAIYETNGEVSEAESNRAFFVAEQRKREIEEE